MKTLPLADGLTYCGVLDPALDVFDIVMKTRYGTTYNAYILKGSEKTVLIETAKHKFLQEYLDSVQSLQDIGSIDFIIVDHTEPDHAGSIEKLVELNPDIEIVGTATAISFLTHIVNRPFKSRAVKDGDTLDLGGKTLTFMPLPNLHWPDTMFTYLAEDKALFTCDVFGAHYSFPGVLRSLVTDEAGYLDALKYYFDGIIGPFKQPYMENALRRIEGLEIRMILTGHGPVLDSHVDEVIRLYQEWVQPDHFAKKTVVMPYVSAYGYTWALAEQIARGIQSAGDVDVLMRDMVSLDAAHVAEEICRADGVLFGTPTMVGEALRPIWDVASHLLPPVVKGKPAGAFGSYGWSGEGVPHITERLRQLKMNVVDGLRVRFKPDERQLADAFDFGARFGRLVLGETEAPKPAEEKAAPKAPAAQVRCKICGAVFDAGVDVCPVCSAKRDQFEPVASAPGTPEKPPEPKAKKAQKRVRCVVCGAVFDAGIDVCPVCGAGGDSLVPVEEEEGSSFSRDTDERFLIIGGGAAAYNAALAIRERNKTCAIVMLCAEEELPYNRPMLTKSMIQGFDADHLRISPRAWYDERRIVLLSGVRVKEIQPEKKTVVTDSGAALVYDRLIYAAGARCFMPPIPGIGLENVVSIREARDVRGIERALPGVREAVVIGGGVLGIEAAWALHKAGIAVTVLEAAPRIMSRQLDEGASRMLTMILEKKGIGLRAGVGIAAIEGDAKVERVTLKDGAQFPAQLVVVSTGVVPNSEVIGAAGAETARGAVVDDHMRTSLPDVYACGDCAVCGGVNFGLWAQAVEMGKIAGANAAGEPLSYHGVPGALTMNAAETSLYAVGENGSSGAYRAEEIRDDEKGVYEKRYYRGDRLKGFILIGDMSRLAAFNKAFETDRAR